VAVQRRLLRRLPVASGVAARLDDLRAERDRLKKDRDRWRERATALTAAPAEDPVTERSAPSFLARTETLRRVRAVSRDLHGRADPIWEYNSKIAGIELARRLKVRVPAQLVLPVPLEDLQLPSVDRLVVKPVSGASSRGVTPLVSAGDGRWRNLFVFGAAPATWTELREDLALLVAQGRISRDFYVEELLPGPRPEALPYDWKLLCVGGQVVLTYQMDRRSDRTRGTPRYRYWSPDWEDLGSVRWPARVDPSLPAPHHPDELIEVAERVAQHMLPTPFLRVDLFDPPSGVVFGEITPQPGTPLWFGDVLDRELGRRWDEYEARSWHEAPSSPEATAGR
jgi:hypothetical protein